MGVRLVAQGHGGEALYLAETDEERPGVRSGAKLCRLYFPDRDYLVPSWKLSLESLRFHDPWATEPVSLTDAERERVEARIDALIEAEARE